ncbi:MAG: alternative ribosome rescue aminoacyl-tRNA hydrolase ArfB [Chloroflexota bacterium]
MISITSAIALDETELHETFIRASGPGGQNVNKVATAVQLRFDARHSPSLPGDVCARLIRLAGKRVNAEGVLLIEAARFRTQEQNRADARARLIALIRQAARPPKPRRATKPARAAKERRLESKKHRGRVKDLRGRVSRDE